MKSRTTMKLISLILLLTMALHLIGCAANSSQAGTSEAQSQEAAGEAEDKDTAGEAQEPAGEEAEYCLL